MKDINLGDILEDGSVVEITMKIENKIEPIYLEFILFIYYIKRWI